LVTPILGKGAGGLDCPPRRGTRRDRDLQTKNAPGEKEIGRKKKRLPEANTTAMGAPTTTHDGPVGKNASVK